MLPGFLGQTLLAYTLRKSAMSWAKNLAHGK